MEEHIDTSLPNIDLPDIQLLGPELHEFARLTGQANGDGEEPMDEEGGTRMGTSGFHSHSEISGSAFGTNGDSGSSEPSKVPNTSTSQKRRRDNATKRGVSSTTMTGRFCGRLPTKEDEKRLVEECKLVGQYLHDDSKLTTMATIIRGIASGTVRAYLENKAREEAEMRLALGQMKEQLEMIEGHADGRAGMVSLTGTIVRLKEQLKATQDELSGLRAEMQANVGVGVTGLQASGVGAGVYEIPGVDNQSCQLPGQVLMERSLSTPMNIQVGNLGTNGAPQVIQQVVVPQVNSLDMGSLHPAPHAQVMTQPLQEPLMNRSASAMQLANLGLDTGSEPVNRTQQMMDTTGSMEASSVPCVPGVAEPQGPGAQQFVRAATLHHVAKEEAAFKAHALTAEARKHSVASIKAAEQAEDLKKTLSSMTDSERVSKQAMEAQKTVKNLEVRAQMHASMTSQAVAKAKNMMEIAQNHEREQAIAIATASALQNQAAAAIGGETSGARSIGAGGVSADPCPIDTLRAVDSKANPFSATMSGSHSISQNHISLPSVVPNSTVSKPDIASLVSNAQGKVGADGLPDTALNLQHAIPPPTIPMPLLDQSISYMNGFDPSLEATAFQQQIAAMHAEQPESLVSAPPICISDTNIENVSIPGHLSGIEGILDVGKVPTADHLDDL